jgi:hypothetical protein
MKAKNEKKILDILIYIGVAFIAVLGLIATIGSSVSAG